MSGSPRLSRKPAPHTDNRVFAVREVQVADSLSPYMAVIAEYSRGQMNTDEMPGRSRAFGGNSWTGRDPSGDRSRATFDP